MIRDEDGLLTGYVYIDIAGRDPNGYVEEAARLLRDKVKLPPGYAISWSGQYEAAQRVKQRLLLVVPLTLFLIFLLLYLNTRSITKTMIIILAVPFSAVGRHLVPVSAGLQPEHRGLGRADRPAGGGCGNRHLHAPLPRPGLRPGQDRKGGSGPCPICTSAIVEGAAKRIRPKFMTAATLFLGLIPIMWAIGHRRRRHETHRRPHDRRHLHLLPPGVDGLPGDLRDLEMEFRGEEKPVSIP